MYDELVKRLQDYAAGTMRDDDAEIAFDAINAIEKLEHKVFILEGDREGLLAQIPRWIPVTERLPENHQSVLVLRDDGGIFIWEYFDQTPTEECWIDDHLNVYSAYCVTHWMPLPEPPEEEK